MNRTRRLIQVVLFAALLATIVLVVRSMRSHSPEPFPADFSADGVGMEQTIFNSDNQPIIELKSASSRRGEKDRIYMTQLNVRILKKQDITDDIQVKGDEGYVGNNYHDLLVRKNAQISSERFILKAETFFLKDRAILKATVPVTFSLRNLEGTAAKGMTYYLDHNMIKLFSTRGVHSRQGNSYDFQADTLWFSKKDRKLILEKNARIQGPGSLLTGDWISLTFNDDMELVQQTRCQGKANFHSETDGDNGNMRNIRCEILTGEHDENGDMRSLSLVRDVTIHLRRLERHIRIRSELIEVRLTPGGDFLEHAQIPIPAEVTHTGGTEFSASASRMEFSFQNGELAQWRGVGSGNLRGTDFSCRSDTIEFDAPHNLIRMKGEESRVIRENNVFFAPVFSIHTEKKWLRGEGGIRATFHPQRPQPPFSDQPFFIRSKDLLILDDDGVTRFSGAVQLFQDKTRLSAESLTLNAKKHLTAEKSVRMVFQSQADDLEAWGEKLLFDPDRQTLMIKGKGGMQSAATRLSAESLILSFADKDGLQTISADGSIQFQKDDITGGADRVRWDFPKRNMRFSGNATLEKKGGGKAEGETLEMDLESNNVRIRSDRQERTSTVLDQ
ncbi:MAG: LPS export ABC transporter periplasmic protein LptC [Candidatus Aminicenantes bacterium]|nr:LPS export ABC transporter periplasmic protein LptC [Candidatus Aminicenantes bacterium]